MKEEMLAVKRDKRTISAEELARRLGQLVLDKKGEDLVILDVREKSSYADFILIASARSARHVQGLADFVEEELYKEHVEPLGVEGKSEGQWVLLDYGDVVLHLFFEPVRDFYDLEGLWMDVPRIEPEEWGLGIPKEDTDEE